MTADFQAWTEAPANGGILFLWEAFVAGEAHCDSDDDRGHERDAATAAVEFLRRGAVCRTDVHCDEPISLLGAAVIWSGWSDDIRWLSRPILVVKPDSAYEGGIAGSD